MKKEQLKQILLLFHISFFNAENHKEQQRILKETIQKIIELLKKSTPKTSI